MCITDPHNPTGHELTPQALSDLADRTSEVGAILLVDRVFADYAHAPRKYETVPVTGYLTRSYSKSLAVSGRAMDGLRPQASPPQQRR